MNAIFITVAIVILVYLLINKYNSRGIIQLGAEAARTMLGNKDTIVLDVRTPSEFKSGHIKGARLMPVQTLGSTMSELEQFKERQIVVYCHSGNRSSVACQLLRKHGFTKVANLRGGITSWQANNFPVV